MHLHNAILVDDEVYTRKGLMKLIDWEACGFRIVAEADNGEDALELIERIRPDLVITDITMPVLDGLELIRRIVEEKTVSPVFIIISGYSDFKYAQQAVRYGVHDFILKPIDEIDFSKTLRKLNERLKQNRVEYVRNERLLTGAMIESLIKGEADEAFVAEWEQRLMLRPNDRLFYMFAELNDNHPWRQSGVQAPTASFKEIVHLAIRHETGDDQPIYLHEHRNRIGILVPDRVLERFGGEVRLFALRIKEALSEADCSIFLYFGTPVFRLMDVPQSYKTAKEALLYKYIHDDGRIVIYDQVRSEGLNYVGIDAGDFNRFIEQIEELQSDAVKATIDSLFLDFRDKRYAPEAVKMNIHQCVLGVTKAIRSMDGDERSLASLEPIVGWHDLNLSLSELKRLFTEFVVESQNCIAHLRKVQLKGAIQKIRSYIEANYSSNISLKSIAAEFYINPVYLGQLFKKTYGVYFNDFLLQIRVNEAKKLLRQSSDMRIYEVAEKVGFSSADYFVTQFEKIERMTPTEYRNKLL
ncbi:response regulator [Cohnella lupini]|uniref:Two-component system response regulator YesN n=1 Tax=Cohnella lupini TaxID=1294267 RepID=A0A3D9HSK2_9BACL|nr:response regulator [Cohnella lupini]RED51836.1 two-component system response regulator YesN [Cohnella lupini]